MNLANLKSRFLFMPVIILASFLIIIGATQALTTTNNPPNLSFPTFGPYAGDGIDPNTGTANETLFSFKIIYTDADNDPPTNLRVVVFYGGTATSTGLFMSPDTDEFINPELRDGNYQNGEQYVVSSTFQKGNYSYIFETNDMKNGGQSVFFPTTTTLTFTVSESVIPPPPPPPPFDFFLSTGGPKTITQGQSITNTITATLTSGSAQPMSFSVVSSPVLTGGTIRFSIASCTPTCVSTATITTITSTPAGTYTITVTGTGGEVSHTASFILTVNALPLPQTLAEKAVEQALKVNTGFYTLGAKGWNTAIGKYVSSDTIKNGTLYTYWNGTANDPNGKGVDCSGLVQWSYNTAFGATKELAGNPVYNWGADGMYTSNIEKITEKDLKPGDLLFFDYEQTGAFMDHVAMYTGDQGDGKDMIEALNPKIGIRRAKESERVKSSEGFYGFGRITAPNINFKARVYSPVDLIITDPEGYTITPETVIVTDSEILHEVPRQLYYMFNGMDSNGNPEAVVMGPNLKKGAYVIKVVPRINTAPDDLYTLDTEIKGDTTVLADNLPVSEIPSVGYGVLVGEQSSIETFYPISIDIKPDSFPNSINLGSRGNVPVVIFSDPDFDASKIAPLSISLAGAHIQIKGKGTPMTSLSDINNDGLQDLIVHIDTEALQLTIDDAKATLRAMTTDGRLVIGSDSVRIVP